MTTKRTPAPWKVEKTHEGDYLAIFGSGLRIADMAGCVNPKYAFMPDEVKANARLIAAAPELLEALKWALDVMEIHEVGIGCGTQKAARTAIAKATEG